MRTFFLCLLFAGFQAQAQQLALPKIENGKARVMIEKYDGWFKEHHKTDGLIIEPAALSALMELKKGRQFRVIFARYLGEDGEKDGVRKRTTLLLYLPSTDKDKTNDEYYDLGAAGTLCPLPRNCGGTE